MTSRQTFLLTIVAASAVCVTLWLLQDSTSEEVRRQTDQSASPTDILDLRISNNGQLQEETPPIIVGKVSESQQTALQLPSTDRELRVMFRKLEFANPQLKLEQRLEVAAVQLQQRYGDVQGEALMNDFRQYASYRHASQFVPLPPGEGNEIDPNRQLGQLLAMRDLAAEMMDNDLRTALIEPWMARREHRLRRSIIVNDVDLGGDDKRVALNNLGNPPVIALGRHSSPRSRFQELKEMYRFDLENGTPEFQESLLASLHYEAYGR